MKRNVVRLTAESYWPLTGAAKRLYRSTVEDDSRGKPTILCD